MYASSFHDLGRFDVLPYAQRLQDWIPHIKYYPEPPTVQAARGNPWQAERQRVLYEAEERAWKEIQRLQALWEAQKVKMEQLVDSYNKAVRAIEDRMGELGQKSPFQTMQTTGGLLMVTPFSLAGKVMLVVAAISQLVDLATGKTRKAKKDLENWMRDLEKLNAQIIAHQQAMIETQDRIDRNLSVSQTVASGLMQQAAIDQQRAESAYLARQEREAMDTAIHQARVRQALTLAPRRMMPDVL